MTLVLPIDVSVFRNEDFFPSCCTKRGDIIGTDDHNRLMKYDKNGLFLKQHSYFSYNLICEVTMYINFLLSLRSDVHN